MSSEQGTSSEQDMSSEQDTISEQTTGSGPQNQLGKTASAYLRSARHQPIAWNEWGPEAFARAARENKPILLDIGAVWCHWCHVMDRESYENLDTAAVINDFYIAVKVDRDERPDVDARYQAAVAAISGQGGWPLTAFLTPEGKPYFGGTYFPHEERYGRPSFQRVLLTMADAFSSRRDEVEESGASVLAAIEHNETFAGRSGALNSELVDKLLTSAIAQFDERNGGFGSQPKFPHSGVLDLLIDAAGRPGPHAERAATVVKITLEKMASGGMYDQLAGGFHRYSVDERWIVPHFEKMAYDNSELLKNYAHAFQTFREPQFAFFAQDILRWMDEWLSDRDLGGFYASQDADDSLEDDGDYFTWTLAEAAAVLSSEELAAATLYFNLRPVGDMHHNPQKCVLHRTQPISAIAAKLGLGEAETVMLVTAARSKMYAARLKRRTPYVDKTLYTGWNAMCISAYLAAGRALDLAAPVDFALKSLDRVLAAAWNPAIGLARVVAYGEGTQGTRVAAVLDDYGFLANACLDAWEVTGNLVYFNVAREFAGVLLDRFCDTQPQAPREGTVEVVDELGKAESHGFFDTEQIPNALGALVTRRKPLQDSPTPSGNALAAMLLLRLHELTGNALYRDRAIDTLETFGGIVEHFGLYAASYGLALRRAIEGGLQVCVISSTADDADANSEELASVALTGYAANKSIVRLTRAQLTSLPPALAETLPHLPSVSAAVAIVCRGMTCQPPVTTPEELLAILSE
jgi:uncharacterized protein YyaL (SSP411 family)